jgi:hypothetical protein
MAGNDSPRLVAILIRLGCNWANCKNRYERAERRLRRATRKASGDDGGDLKGLQDEADALREAYEDHPFPNFVRWVSQETGDEQSKLLDAALKEFDGETELVPKLNELDEKGRTAVLLQRLHQFYPDVASRLFEVEAGSGPPSSKTKTAGAIRPQKRSTEKGEARLKLIAALTKHHDYAHGSCLNLEPVGNNELAQLADVSVSTASEFFNKQFGGHTKYRALCQDVTLLVAALKLLNQEFTPQNLYGAKLPGEGERENEE